MSEQLPINGLQFAAQPAPQAAKTPAGSNGIAVTGFRKLLSEQGLELAKGLLEEQPFAAGLLNALPAQLQPTAVAAGGNVLPEGGTALQQQALPAANTLLLAKNNTAGDTQPATAFIGNLATDEAGEFLKQPASSAPLTPLSDAARHLQASLVDSAKTKQDATLPLASQGQDETSLDIDNLLQELTGKQGLLTRAADQAADTNSFRNLQQQAAASQLQPPGQQVTYQPVGQPLNNPAPADGGVLPSQPTTPVYNLSTPLQHADWSKVFAERTAWLVNNNQSAQLRLSPASLGQIDIQLHLNKDEASITFNTQNAAVKETVEASLPRLRDMLESQGLNLVDVNVNERNSSGREQFTSAFDEHDRFLDEAEADAMPVASLSPVMLVSSDALDLYV